jgi:carbamoyltransferase
MIVLGFSVGHDKGAVIIKDGRVVIGISQERLSRLKHDGAFTDGAIPVESIMYCLSELDLTIDDLDLIVYSTTELIDNTYEQFNKIFRIPKKKLEFIPHHLAHAYSTFFSSGFDDAAVVVADASGSILNNKTRLGEWYPEKTREGLNPEEDWTEGISIYHFNKNEYKEVYKKWIKYPVPIGTNEDVSVGTMYSEGCHRLIYSPDTNSWPAGKLMGLASYADENIVSGAENFIKYENGEIFIPNNPIYPRVTWRSDFFSKACVAGIYQREQERVSVMLADLAKNLTKSKSICVAGGSFLNCNSNELILKSELYQNCFFVPPADDSGIPLGCAWYAYQQVSDIGPIAPISPYFGKTYSDEEIKEAVKDFEHLKVEHFENFDDLVESIADRLVENRVVGWFQGGSEIGPRALGNRSIIASPKTSWMKDHINHDIKKREWYRPFAPAVIFDHQKEIFDNDYFSPFMLVTALVKEEWRTKIPAVTHIDNSARYQSVTPVSNPRFYQIIDKFYQRTGIPVLLNTSFNGPHEPIVETPLDAIKTFESQNLDFLVVGNYVISHPWR